jgi:uncharacterized DUF497 family protein
MRFEWDDSKNLSNLAKHGINFETARNLWLDENRIEISAPHPVENRGIMIGKHQEKLWTAIFTVRGDVIRIISVRRARKKEVKLYEKEKDGRKY